MPSVLRNGLKTLFGLESRHALPALLCSAEALRHLVGVNAQQVRQGVGQRGATKRQGGAGSGADLPRYPGPADREAAGAGPGGGLQRGDARLGEGWGLWGEGHGQCGCTDRETTERAQGCGQVTRQVRAGRRRMGERTRVRSRSRVEGTLLIDAVTKIPLAGKGGPIDAHETPWTRALVTQARAHLAGTAGLYKRVCDRGCLEGTDLWWLDQQGILWVGPAKTTRAVTVEARAPAAAGAGLSHGRRCLRCAMDRGKPRGQNGCRRRSSGSAG